MLSRVHDCVHVQICFDQVFEKKPIRDNGHSKFWIDIGKVQKDYYGKNIRSVFWACSKRNICRCILVLNQTM